MRPLKSPIEGPRGYSITSVTDQWEWDVALAVQGLDQARSASREALEAVVRDEEPELACVYLLEHGRRIGVWDWVERQFHWNQSLILRED